MESENKFCLVSILQCNWNYFCNAQVSWLEDLKKKLDQLLNDEQLGVLSQQL